MDAPAFLKIPARFNGPPTSGNGGYSAGLLAALVRGPAVVSLKSPPPLDTRLEIRRHDDRLEARHGKTVVMYAKAQSPKGTVPEPPSLDLAQRGGEDYPVDSHPLPTCFVCGPHRAPGDGLRIFAGRVDGFQGAVAVWTPSSDLADDHGRVEPAVMWAALDCPSYFAIPSTTRLTLLGSMCARIDQPAQADEPVIVVGWHQSSTERKHLTGSALFTREGRLLGQADTLWIELRDQLPRPAAG